MLCRAYSAVGSSSCKQVNKHGKYTAHQALSTYSGSKLDELDQVLELCAKLSARLDPLERGASLQIDLSCMRLGDSAPRGGAEGGTKGGGEGGGGPSNVWLGAWHGV